MTDQAVGGEPFAIAAPARGRTGLAKVARTGSQDMKRIRVAPGKFVTISSELAEKAARVSATAPTRDQVLESKSSEPKRITAPQDHLPVECGKPDLIKFSPVGDNTIAI